jgi:peptidoglycan/xylan/chitin deacetylase (PgdA/CDA1 family)
MNFNMNKPVLMIHNITSDIFNLPLADYILTFDDGTRDHYTHFKEFKKIDTRKIYFIIADRVGTEGYLTVDEIKDMMKDPQVTIGAHSYNHTNLESLPKLFDQVFHIQKDTELMIDWFNTNLEYCPTVFCFPYNNDLRGMYGGLVKKYGFTELYGHERIPVETLLHTDFPQHIPYT